MKFSSYLNPDFIFTDLKGATPKEVILEMVERIAQEENKVMENKEAITKAILKREKEISTAIGEGIAIPHARIENFEDFIISIGVLDTPIHGEVAGSSEKDKIDLVFLIISDVLKNKNILKSMSAISKIGLRKKEIFDKIRKEKNQKKIISYIQEADVELEHKIVAEDVLSPTIKPAYSDNTLEDIAKRFILENISGLPVVDKDGYFLGEITEKELIDYGMPKYLSLMENLNFFTLGEPFEEYLVNESKVTIKNLYRISRDIVIDRKTPIMEICFLMVHKGITRLYVIDDNGKYYGMIKRSDIIKKVLHL